MYSKRLDEYLSSWLLIFEVVIFLVLVFCRNFLGESNIRSKFVFLFNELLDLILHYMMEAAYLWLIFCTSVTRIRKGNSGYGCRFEKWTFKKLLKQVLMKLVLGSSI